MTEVLASYNVWILGQVILGLLLYKFFKNQINSISSINTLVLSPIAPYLALVLFVLTRVKDKDYYRGYIFLLPLIMLVVLMKDIGPTIIYFSIALTCIVYAVTDGIGRVVVSLVIGWLCKGMDNPISFIIICNMYSDYIVRRYMTTNKHKWTKDGYDNEGINYTLFGAFLEAAFIGAPSDIVSRNRSIMDGLSDALCIINLLVNSSQRGSATVIVTNLPTAIVFFVLITLVYFYSNLEYIKEEDKVWPAIKNIEVCKITNLQLLIVTATLVMSYSITSYIDVLRFVIVMVLCTFVRIKVVTSTFFSANMLFKV